MKFIEGIYYDSTPEITIEQIMNLCLDEIYKILVREQVGMAFDLINKAFIEMNIIPVFTYRQIIQQMNKDKRFVIFQDQICSLSGTDPVELMVKKLKL